jgi:hypothetical protein
MPAPWVVNYVLYNQQLNKGASKAAISKPMKWSCLNDYLAFGDFFGDN